MKIYVKDREKLSSCESIFWPTSELHNFAISVDLNINLKRLEIQYQSSLVWGNFKFKFHNLGLIRLVTHLNPQLFHMAILIDLGLYEISVDIHSCGKGYSELSIPNIMKRTRNRGSVLLRWKLKLWEMCVQTIMESFPQVYQTWTYGVANLKIIWSTCSMTTSWHKLPLNHLFYVYPVIN